MSSSQRMDWIEQSSAHIASLTAHINSDASSAVSMASAMSLKSFAALHTLAKTLRSATNSTSALVRPLLQESGSLSAAPDADARALVCAFAFAGFFARPIAWMALPRSSLVLIGNEPSGRAAPLSAADWRSLPLNSRFRYSATSSERSAISSGPMDSYSEGMLRFVRPTLTPSPGPTSPLPTYPRRRFRSTRAMHCYLQPRQNVGNS